MWAEQGQSKAGLGRCKARRSRVGRAGTAGQAGLCITFHCTCMHALRGSSEQREPSCPQSHGPIEIHEPTAAGSICQLAPLCGGPTTSQRYSSRWYLQYQYHSKWYSINAPVQCYSTMPRFKVTGTMHRLLTQGPGCTSSAGAAGEGG